MNIYVRLIKQKLPVRQLLFFFIPDSITSEFGFKWTGRPGEAAPVTALSEHQQNFQYIIGSKNRFQFIDTLIF